MRFSIPTIALAFGSPASAFVVSAYPDYYCKGEPQHVNVYDNTCASWMNPFLSVKIRHYSPYKYIARFYAETECTNWWVDWLAGRSETLSKGECVNIDRFGGHPAQSMSNFYNMFGPLMGEKDEDYEGIDTHGDDP